MATIDFTDNTTVVPASWLDDVNKVTYEQHGVGKTTVASATTPDIFAATVGNFIDYTGTVTCTGFAAAVSAGSHRTLYCAGAAVFTAGANLLIDGVASGSNLTCVAGDILEVVANTTTQFKITQLTSTFLAATGKVTSSSPSAGIGYAAGAGGTVTQATDIYTGVTLNKVSGEIILISAALASASSYGFTLTNSTLAATDTLSFSTRLVSGLDPALICVARSMSAGSCVILLKPTTDNTGSVAINFNVHKGVKA